MFRITKQYHFSASHQILSMPKDNQCRRLHGHNYIAEIELQSEELDEHGFVRNFHDLAAFKQYIDDTLDHRHLNDVLGDEFTSSEYVAKHLFDWAKARWPEVSAMRIYETPKTMAEYREA